LVLAGFAPGSRVYNELSMLIRARQPFDFQRTLRFILSPPRLLDRPLLDHFAEGEYRRAAEINGQPVLYGVSEASRARKKSETPTLEVRILAGPHDALTKQAVTALVRRQFSTDLDLEPFYRLAGADPVLSRLVTHFRGMRIPQAPTVFETLISAILEQQVNLAFAHQVKEALVKNYGDQVEFEGRIYRVFPEPAALAITTPEELRRLQISGPKARYLIGLARAALDGRLDLEALRAIEPSQAHARLLREKGVGMWTAQYVGLRALGQLDCLPAADVGLQKVIQRFYGLRKPPTSARVEKIAKAWTGWRSYATFYLWLTYWEDAEWRDRLEEELRSERRKSRGLAN
jgi:DNA-3-methyladenine glycosylase II